MYEFNRGANNFDLNCMLYNIENELVIHIELLPVALDQIQIVKILSNLTHNLKLRVTFIN